MSDTPVSVVVLTYNNPDMLRGCLESVLSLDYPHFEVIVVDNASTDDTVEIVRNEFGSRVKLLVCEENSPVAARNKGYWSAQGEFVLSLDHDMIISDPHFLHKAVDLFRAYPQVGLLAVNICGQEEPERALEKNWWYGPPIEMQDRFFFTTYFNEGAAVIRTEALKKSGGYDERFHHVAENADLAFKLLNLDWQILYCPTLATVELVVRDHLSRRRTESNYYSLRNRLWLAWKYYPFPQALLYALPRIAVDSIRSIRFGWFDYYLAGLREGVFAPASVRGERRPLTSAQWAERRRMEGRMVEPTG